MGWFSVHLTEQQSQFTPTFRWDGSITPQCDVNIAFYLNGDTTQTTGFGKFTQREDHKHVFLMQMTTSRTLNASFIGVAHWNSKEFRLGGSKLPPCWAYMVSITPDDYWYHHIPGTEYTLSEYLGLFQTS